MRNLLLDNEFMKIESESGIVIGTFNTDLTDIETIKSIVKMRIEVTQNLDPYPLIVNIKNVKNSTKEVRDFLASKKAAERVTVTALVVESMLTATIGNFFLRISKPPVPTKIFTDEVSATNWLNAYKG